MKDMIRSENKFWRDYEYETHPELYDTSTDIEKLNIEQIKNIHDMIAWANELSKFGYSEYKINEIMFNEKNRI